MTGNDISSPLRVFRYELKYLLSYHDYEIARRRLSRILTPDQHTIAGGYLVRSLYFDNHENSAYWEKIDGIEMRSKVRLRTYSPVAEQLKLELKSRNNNYMLKETLSVDREQARCLIHGDAEWLRREAGPLPGKLYRMFKRGNLRPVVLIDYNREAFVYKLNNVRVTFDLRLHAGLHSFDIFSQNPAAMRLFPDPVYIMEVKYNGILPIFITHALTSMRSAVQTSLSKYAMTREYNSYL